MMPKSNSSNFQQDLVNLYRQAVMSGLSVDEVGEKIGRHIKRVEASRKIELQQEKERDSVVKNRLPKAVRWGATIIPGVFILVGLYLMGSAVAPILGYYVMAAPELSSSTLVAPIPQDEVMDITPFVISSSTGQILGLDKPNEPKIIDLSLDYTNLANWFVGTDLPEFKEGESAEVTEYLVDIPSLDIESAHVVIGGTNLNENLIAYPGTAFPGQYGAPVIFGHSVLRQFYNPSPKNPRRYNSIFSKIMTLKPGVDKIYVTADGVKYTYLVQEKIEVKPEDVYILTQQYDAKRLKLVTCVPEGTYLRRGVVSAQLVSE